MNLDSANVRLMALSDRLSEKNTQRKIIDISLSYVLKLCKQKKSMFNDNDASRDYSEGRGGHPAKNLLGTRRTLSADLTQRSRLRPQLHGPELKNSDENTTMKYKNTVMFAFIIKNWAK